MTAKLSSLYTRALVKKRWHNVGEFCNRKRHPILFHYRRYRRGKNRCKYCGAKVGKIKCVYRSAQELLVDNLWGSTPIMDILKRRGGVLCHKHQGCQ